MNEMQVKEKSIIIKFMTRNFNLLPCHHVILYYSNKSGSVPVSHSNMFVHSFALSHNHNTTTFTYFFGSLWMILEECNFYDIAMCVKEHEY